MAITNKATLLRIKKMIEVDGGCPWGEPPHFKFITGPGPCDHEPKCKSCNKVMDLPTDIIYCPCHRIGYETRAHSIALQKIRKAGLD